MFSSLFAFKCRLLLAIALILGYPLAFSLWVSLHDCRLTAIAQAQWVGLGQHLAVLTQNASFWNALRSTLFGASPWQTL